MVGMEEDYAMTAMVIIEEVLDYIEDEYNLKPKPRLAKLLGVDYYILEDSIKRKIKNLVMRQANKLVHGK